MPPVAYIPSISGTLGDTGVCSVRMNQFLLKVGLGPLISKLAQHRNTHKHVYMLASERIVVISNRSRPRAPVWNHQTKGGHSAQRRGTQQQTLFAYGNSTWHASKCKVINSTKSASSKKWCPQWHIYPPFHAHSATQVCTGIRKSRSLPPPPSRPHHPNRSHLSCTEKTSCFYFKHFPSFTAVVDRFVSIQHIILANITMSAMGRKKNCDHTIYTHGISQAP